MNQPSPRTLEYWASVKGRDAALIEGENRLTWSGWNELSNLLAATLDGRGIGPGDAVGVRTRTRMEWAVIAAAIAKVGARLVAIDSRLDPRALRDVMIDSGACALFLDDADPRPAALALSGLPLRLRASIDTDIAGFMPFADLFPPAARPRFAAGLPAAAVYTSTQPGQLLGVTISPRAPVAAHQARGTGDDDGVSLVTARLSGVSGYRQIQLALGAGRSLVFMRTFEPEAALALIARRRVTEWTLSTTTCGQLAALPDTRAEAFDLSSLKHAPATTRSLGYADKARIARLLGAVLSESSMSLAAGPITAMPQDARAGWQGSSDRSDQTPPAGSRDTRAARTQLDIDGASASIRDYEIGGPMRRPGVRQHS